MISNLLQEKYGSFIDKSRRSLDEKRDSILEAIKEDVSQTLFEDGDGNYKWFIVYPSEQARGEASEAVSGYSGPKSSEAKTAWLKQTGKKRLPRGAYFTKNQTFGEEIEPVDEAIFNTDRYNWYTYKGTGPKEVPFRGNIVSTIRPGDIFGLRPATSKVGATRMILGKEGKTKVHTVSPEATEHFISYGTKVDISKILRENSIELEEVSKAVLSRYTKSAVADNEKRRGAIESMGGVRVNNKGRAALGWRRPGTPDRDLDAEELAGEEQRAQNVLRKQDNRRKGISVAIDKLAKEDVEQIDEISRKKLGNYLKKATNDFGDRQWERGSASGETNGDYWMGDKHDRKTGNRQWGIDRAVSKLTGAKKEKFEISKRHELKAKNPTYASVDLKHPKSRVLATEGNEPLQELSGETLVRYKRAAYDRITRQRQRLVDDLKAKKDYPKRAIGISRASDALEREAKKHHLMAKKYDAVANEEVEVSEGTKQGADDRKEKRYFNRQKGEETYNAYLKGRWAKKEKKNPYPPGKRHDAWKHGQENSYAH